MNGSRICTNAMALVWLHGRLYIIYHIVFASYVNFHVAFICFYFHFTCITDMLCLYLYAYLYIHVVVGEC